MNERKVTTADEVRDAIRALARSGEDGAYNAIETEIARMRKSGDSDGKAYLSHKTPNWLLDEIGATYRAAGFQVTIEDLPSDGRAVPDEGNFLVKLHVK